MARRPTREELAEQKRKDSAGICGFMKPSGNLCERMPGWGTKHKGKGRCKDHDGKPGLVSAARKLGDPLAVTPTQAITGVLHLAAGNLAYVTAMVLDLDEDEYWEGDNKQRPNKYIRWQERLMDKVAKYASVAVQMGVSERQVALAEQQTKMMAELLTGVMDEVGLTPEQRKRVGPAIRGQLAAVETTAREVVPA